MIDGKQLWKQRMIAHMAEVRRYGRYMFNDHLLLVLFISIGVGAVFYKRAVDELTLFPYAIVASLLIAFAVTQGGVRTLVKEADAVFLLPVERRLRPYFGARQDIVFSSFVCFAHRLRRSFAPSREVFNAATFSCRDGNCIINRVEYVRSMARGVANRARSFSHIRSLFSKCDVVLFLLLKQYVWMLVPLLFMVIISLYVERKGKENAIQWEQLLADERKRMQAFYRLAHAFVDVPYIKHTVKNERGFGSFSVYLIVSICDRIRICMHAPFPCRRLFRLVRSPNSDR